MAEDRKLQIIFGVRGNYRRTCRCRGASARIYKSRPEPLDCVSVAVDPLTCGADLLLRVGLFSPLTSVYSCLYSNSLHLTTAFLCSYSWILVREANCDENGRYNNETGATLRVRCRFLPRVSDVGIQMQRREGIGRP